MINPHLNIPAYDAAMAMCTTALNTCTLAATDSINNAEAALTESHKAITGAVEKALKGPLNDEKTTGLELTTFKTVSNQLTSILTDPNESWVRVNHVSIGTITTAYVDSTQTQRTDDECLQGLQIIAQNKEAMRTEQQVPDDTLRIQANKTLLIKADWVMVSPIEQQR